jgi:outer membrane lipoprotein-sorting protein
VSVVTKWAPAALVAVVITGGSVAIPLQANAVNLPEISVEELVELLDVEVTGFSGTLVKTTDLGLPALEMSSLVSPAMAEEMAAAMPEGLEDFLPQVLEQNLFNQAIAFIAGSDTIRIFASEEGFRAQILDPMSQRDIIVSRTDVWAYDASTQKVFTRSISTDVTREDFETKLSELEIDLSDPRAIAEYVLEQAGPDTALLMGADHRIAGRTAYALVVEPRSGVSLVSSIEISVDSENGMPLGVTVFSSEQTAPAAVVAFSSISFETPDPSLSTFTPPPGTTVEVLELPASLEEALSDLESGALTQDQAITRAMELGYEFAPDSEVVVIGERWETVVSLTKIPDFLPTEMLQHELLQELMVAVPGGHVFSTPLMNVLVTDSGQVFAGAVTSEHLVSVASR